MAGSEQTDNKEAERPSLKRLLTLGGFFAALSAAGLFAIYHDIADQAVVFDSRLLAWPVLLTIALLLAVYFTADGLRLHYTLKALGHRLPLRHVFRLVFINIFFANVTPLASGGGFAQIWYLRRHGVPVGTATTATTIRTALAVIFIFSTTPVLLFTLDILEAVRPSSGMFALLALFVAIYLGVFTIVLFRTRWLLSPMHAVLYVLHRGRLINQHRHRRWRFGLKRELVRFARGFRIYLSGDPVNTLLSVVFTVVFLVCLFSFPAVLLWSLGYEVSYLTVISLMVVTTFTMYFSPTPGAAGIAEGVFGYLFAGIIVAGHLVLITIAWRFLTIYLGMLAGVAVMHDELRRSLRRHG